jgi:hypothetical protein
VQSAAALRQEIEEIAKARDFLSTSNKEDQIRLRELEKDLSKALSNRKSELRTGLMKVELVGKDESTQIERTSLPTSLLDIKLTCRFEGKR